MKRKLSLMLAGVCAAAALLSCQKEIAEVPASDEMTLEFTAEPVETRAAFMAPEGTTYPVVWTANDKKAKISLNFAKQVDASIEPAADGKSARFVAKISQPSPAPADYTFYLISPASAVTGDFNSQYSSVTVTIPAVQTPLAASPDEAAMILAGQSAKLTELSQSIPVTFNHFTAYGKMSLKNLSLGEAKIFSVELKADAPIAGKWYYYPLAPLSSKAVSETDGRAISLLTDKLEDIWFACAPVDLSGKKLTVTVKTDVGDYTRTVTLPAERKFESGKISIFSFDMASATLRPAAIYERIKSADELVPNAKVVIAAVDPALNFAIASVDKGNNRAETAINRIGDKIYVASDDVEIFRVGTGSAAGSYTLKATSPTAPGYIVGVSGSNYLKTAAAADEFADWKVELVDNFARIQNVKSERFIRYNKSSNLFSTYAASSAVKDSVAIYRLAGATPKTDPELKIEHKELTVIVGSSAEIGIESCKSLGAISYRSDDVAVATVDEEGMVMGVAPGTCNVYVTVAETETYDAATLLCKVTVKSAEAKTLPYAETFNNTLGDFVTDHKTLPSGLSYVWIKNSGYVKGSAYVSSTYYKAEDWLVSPAISLSGVSQAMASFEYVINYGDEETYSSQFYLQIYDGTSWTKVTIPGIPTAGSWDFKDAVVDLTAYVGKTIKLAFVYNSTALDGSAPTIEVRKLKVAEIAEGKISMKGALSFEEGDSPANLQATVNSGATISYASNKTSVATVDESGNVTPVGEGEATITATSPAKGLYGAATATCVVTVSKKGGKDYSITYTSNVALSTTGGTSASAAKVVIAGSQYDALKAGTSSVAGAVKIKVPAGTTKLHFHAFGWKNENVTLSLDGGNATPASVSLTFDNGVTSNSPFTLTTVENSYHSATLSGVSAETEITIKATAGKRFVIWGVNAE